MKSATEVSPAWRPVRALQGSASAWAPATTHLPDLPASPAGQGDAGVQEGSALRPWQGINYQALPYVEGKQEARVASGTGPRQPAERCTNPSLSRGLPEPALSSFPVITLLALWTVKSQSSTLGLRLTFTMRSWVRHKRCGWKSAPGCLCLSPTSSPSDTLILTVWWVVRGWLRVPQGPDHTSMMSPASPRLSALGPGFSLLPVLTMMLSDAEWHLLNDETEPFNPEIPPSPCRCLPVYPYSTFLFFLVRYSPPYVKVDCSTRVPCPDLCSPLVLCFVCFSVLPHWLPSSSQWAFLSLS